MAVQNMATHKSDGSTQDALENRRSFHNDPGRSAGGGLHPAWQALIRFCREVGHGEIERIKIQDGLPVSAEVVTNKIRWC
jgi:hypothetical protein